MQYLNVTSAGCVWLAIAVLRHFFGISATFVSVIAAWFSAGSFQAFLLGISVMTGSISFYLTMQWALSCSLCYTGMASAWHRLLMVTVACNA